MSRDEQKAKFEAGTPDRKTLFGTEFRPCSRHGWEDVGVLTGLCLVCEREIDRAIYRKFIDSFLARTSPQGDDSLARENEDAPARRPPDE